MVLHLARILPAQAPGEPPLPGWTWGLVIALVGAAAALAWAVAQLRASRRRLAQLTVEHESTTTAHRELLERERKQTKTLDGKRGEIAELKREMAAQRKKTHAQQEEAKALRKEVRDVMAELNEARRQPRPAFEDKPETAPARSEPAPAPPPEPERDKKPAPAPSPGLEARVAELDAQVQEKQRVIEGQRSEAKAMRTELRSLRRRVEGLRRIDLISTGKIEILEDKLRVLGRQYYDAISELAALRGEVQPPAPRELVENSHRRDEIVDVASAASDPDVADDMDDARMDDARMDDARADEDEPAAAIPGVDASEAAHAFGETESTDAGRTV